MTELHDSDSDAFLRGTEAALRAIEDRLLQLIREGGGGTRPLSDVTAEIIRLVTEIKPVFKTVQDALDRPDPSFAVASDLEGLRARCLWLYRKCRLEHIFFAGLLVERSLRGALHRQTVETWEELGALEEEEQKLRAADDAELGRGLMEPVG